MCSHINAIEQFIEHFQNQKVDIASVKPIIYRKLVYVAALDSIARAAFGDVGNKRRNIRLIDELTKWVDRDRVSLPQLCLALERNDQLSSKLWVDATERLKRWGSGEVVHLNRSPLLAELAALAQKTEEKMLKECRYAELYYRYRNALVHEFREPGYGIERSTDRNEPYYHSMLDKQRQLVFPIGFFARIYDEALAGLKAYLIRCDINPYSQFNLGSEWPKNKPLLDVEQGTPPIG